MVEKEVCVKENHTDLQLISIKKIYDEIIRFLKEFEYTGGFTSALWFEFKKKYNDDPEERLYNYVESKMNVINVVFEQEYFYLHNLNIYSEIKEYIENDLIDIYNGKLGYAYRFEAFAEGHPTTWDDYNKALNRINEIISKCVN